MRVHRSARARFFTTLGNEVLRDSRLSFCARGVLGYLLSLPDGQRGDIRTLAERAPEGRERIASALRELERFGYLRREVKRTSDGRIHTEVDVFDTPNGLSSLQVAPSSMRPVSGGRATTPDVDHPMKERDEEPTLPVAPASSASEPASPAAGRAVADGDKEAKASAELLARVARAEPKLSLGWAETLHLVPLVIEWRRRGASDLHIISSLTSGLPRAGVHHPARFIETRLRAKMPAERRVPAPPEECDGCGVPITACGLCGACSRASAPLGSRTVTDLGRTRTRGVAMARAALRGLSIDAAAPVGY